jgi:hypothetical protein
MIRQAELVELLFIMGRVVLLPLFFISKLTINLQSLLAKFTPNYWSGILNGLTFRIK